MIETLSREISPLIPVPDPDPRAPATEYTYADGLGMVGFIASVTRPFCLNCNRIRLTSDGKLRYCLFAIDETDVKGLLCIVSADHAIIRSLTKKRSVYIGARQSTIARVPNHAKRQLGMGG